MRRCLNFFRYRLIAAVALVATVSCAPGNDPAPCPDAFEPPHHTFRDAEIWPGDGSLLRAEDGAEMNDGSVLVVDQAHGLRKISPDGGSRPFGRFDSTTNFVHRPPDQLAGPNGIFLSDDGSEVLVSDVFTGKLYRTDVASETTEMFYDHPFGVNTLVCDSLGGIWFTQSTRNTDMTSLFTSVDRLVSDGAVWYLAPDSTVPQRVADGLFFANGITFDQTREYLYVAETMMDRVLRFPVDQAAGILGAPEIYARVPSPDNLAFDRSGFLLIACPIANQVRAVHPGGSPVSIVFDASTDTSRALAAEWMMRSRICEPLLDLMQPAMFQPMPGLLTGVFLSSEQRRLYISNLGNDLVRVSWRQE